MNEGKYLRGFSHQKGSNPGQFLAPHGLAMNSQGDLYVVDSYNHRVQKFWIPSLSLQITPLTRQNMPTVNQEKRVKYLTIY